MKTYRVYCYGYVRIGKSLAMVDSFLEELRARDCVGHEVQIHVGVTTGTATIYQSKPARVGILTERAA